MSLTLVPRGDLDASIYGDAPPYHNHDSFRYWKSQDYVPTARLDGRTEWLAIKNLRHISTPCAVACPHNMKEFIELERLHKAVSRRTFYAPRPNAMRGVCYVSMIPRPVVEWFSQHTLAQVHEQIALYLALRIVICGDQELFLRDSFHSYHAKILANVRGIEAKLPGELPDDLGFLCEYVELLPLWLRPILIAAHDGMTFDYWSLPCCEQGMPWERPDYCYIDELGAVCYGLTASDERGIDKAVYIEAHKEVPLAKQKPPPGRPLSYDDQLQRSEACPDAFEHLTYARHVKSAWGVPWAGEEPGKVYLIQDGYGRVKIGWTSGDPVKRLASLQTGSATPLRLLGTVSGPQTLEKHLHCQYEDSKAYEGRTEWFSLQPIDVLEILGLV